MSLPEGGKLVAPIAKRGSPFNLGLRPPSGLMTISVRPGRLASAADRAKAREASLRAHGARIKRQYGISRADYWALYAHQLGRCALCRRATGATKRLAVDHDHAKGCSHPPTLGCPECVRGLLCGPCNRLLGHIRDDPTRLVDYLANPPFQQLRQGPR